MELIGEELTAVEIQEMYQTNYISFLTEIAQDILDTTARTRNYDNILSACSYLGSGNPQFAVEAQACINWRDAVWTYSYNLLTEYCQGLRGIPTKEEFLANLPQIQW